VARETVALLIFIQYVSTRTIHCDITSLGSVTMIRLFIFRTTIFLVAGIAAQSQALTSHMGCRTDANELVDWFVAYKLPENKTSLNPLAQQGKAYMIITARDVEPISWKVSLSGIDDKRTAVAHTMNQLYSTVKSKTNQLLYIMYNDEGPDNQTTETMGHTKGVVVSGPKTGFWLIHSVPKFPPGATEGYSYPSTGTVYGQSILCISFNISDADNIAQLLQYNQPYIYEFALGEKVSKRAQLLAAVANGTAVPAAPWNTVVNFKSMFSTKFVGFAKSDKYNADLYSNLVSPHLQSDLFAETWQHGANRSASNCSGQYHVQNVQELQVPLGGSLFNSTKDHSKWAVSQNAASPWVCVGDINRAASQWLRGGGTVCMYNKGVWLAYRSLVVEAEPCPSTEHRQV